MLRGQLSVTSDQRSGGKRKNRSEDRPLQRRGDARPATPSGTHTTRPSPSSAPRWLATSHPPLATAVVSPLFPLLPGNSPVTPLFPLLTQKQGGGVYLCSLSVLPSLVLGVYPGPVGVPGACPDPVGMVHRCCSAFSFSPLATRWPAEASAEEGHSPLTPIIPAPLATAALRVVPAPIFTTTSRIHVGAPTFLECGGLPPLYG